MFGNRIEKAVDWDGDGPAAAVVRRYVLDGLNNSKPTPIGNEHFDIHAELDGTNQLIARYLHGDGFDQTFARVDLRAANASERVLWYLTDHLNSVRLVLDESGAVLDQIAYDAFGNIVAQLNPLVDNPLLFTSREFDAETGLYYNRARYLDPTTGRWTTQDPMGFAAGDANLYRYVGNTPTMLVDPSGLAEEDPLTQGPYGVVGRIALWWFSNGDEHKPIPRNFDPTRTMPGLRMGDSIDRENKLWYDQTLNAAPKVMIVTGFVILGMVIPGPEDAFIAWAAGRGITVVKNGGTFIFKRGTQELAENEVKALIGAYKSATSTRAVYKSISDALGGRLTGFVARQNGLTKHPVKNTELLKKLREIEPGNWQKVYKDGTLDGKKVSIHYFESPSGQVFDVQIKPGWSN
jgi:RHS repeat-associated protein